MSYCAEFILTWMWRFELILYVFQTWAEAGIQVFYTLGPCWGGIITMSSHNKFDNNLLR